MTNEERKYAKMLGQRISNARKNMMMSQHELSRKSGVSQSTITRIEAGKIIPNIVTVTKLHDVLGFFIPSMNDAIHNTADPWRIV